MAAHATRTTFRRSCEMRRTARLRCFAIVLLLVASVGCWFPIKVPLVDVGAKFAIADMTWFEDEQTLFVFYRVNAEQGLSPLSQIEITYRTDNDYQPFVHLQSLPGVHTHVAANCGVHTMCGSYSVHVQLEPRDMALRLRYHKDGKLTLAAPVQAHVVQSGPIHTNRSAIVYGVFNDDNTRVQWRLRHQFPAIRNPAASALGLRREFTVETFASGTLSADVQAAVHDDNPYGYGISSVCPLGFAQLGDWDALRTRDRARFHPNSLPLTSSDDAVLCARSTVVDASASGRFTTVAVAQKNPQVAPAFPALHSPLSQNTQLKYFIQTCTDIVSDAHLQMQRQRLFLSDAEIICVDPGIEDVNFVADLSQRFQDRIDAERVFGNDMVLVIGLQRPDNANALAAAIEAALGPVFPFEAAKSSPRLSGAFVFDSAPHAITDAVVARHTLWCPADIGDDLEAVSDASLRSCAVVPDQVLQLGPVSLTSLPILPSRKQYTKFIEKYGEAQTGAMDALDFLAPLQTPLSHSVDVDPFGVVTFYNDEAITAEPDDAFSYCATDDLGVVVFQVQGVPEIVGPVPLLALPFVQAAGVATRYELGVLWDFPYLLHLNYTTVLAGEGTAYGFTVPFGKDFPGKADFGSPVWTLAEFDISTVLTQCSRFCGHPTFDSAGVYNVLVRFNESYLDQCYTPKYPDPADGGFPVDP